MDAFWWLSLSVRATAVLGAALVLDALLRRASAAVRHLLFTLTAAGLLALPVLPLLLPRWELPFWPRWPSAVSTPALSANAAALAPGVARGPELSFQPAPTREGVALDEQAPTGSGHEPALPVALVGIWLAGALASLLRLARALRRECGWLACAEPFRGPAPETLDEARTALGIHARVRVLGSAQIESPVTGWWGRHMVLLPAAAEFWPAERLLVVLQHELVHVRRADALRNLAWRLVSSLYWFHPLVRPAQEHASLAREQACDERVLGLGNRPSVYARHLLEIAESIGAPPLSPAGALPMVERNALARRLAVILDPQRSTSRRSVHAVAALVLMGATVLAAAIVAPRPVRVLAVANAAAPKHALVVSPALAALRDSSQSACGDERRGSFQQLSVDDSTTTEMSGTPHSRFTLQLRLGNGKSLCARVSGAVRLDPVTGAIREMPKDGALLVETRGQGRSQRMLVMQAEGQPRYEWRLDGAVHAVDAAARAWLDDALATIAGRREIGEIQGRVGSLQGEIGTIHGEVGTLQGEIGTIHGEVGTLQGQIGAIHGERGTLQGKIGTHQGAIGTLQGLAAHAGTAEQARIERETAEHRQAIEKLEAELASREFEARIAAVNKQIAALAQDQPHGQIAAVEQRIRDVRAEERIAALERQIEALHADERVRAIERRLAPVLERLERYIDQLGG